MAHRQNSQDYNQYTGNHYGSPPQQHQYRNEFNEGYGGYGNARHNDSDNDGPYDPYGGYNAYNNHQPHQTYDQGGYNQYTGAAGYHDVDRNSLSLEDHPPAPPSKENAGDSTAYEHDDQMVQARPRGKLAGS
jgi:hypothetical protein